MTIRVIFSLIIRRGSVFQSRSHFHYMQNNVKVNQFNWFSSKWNLPFLFKLACLLIINRSAKPLLTPANWKSWDPYFLVTNPIRKHRTRDERAWINILASWDAHLMNNGNQLVYTLQNRNSENDELAPNRQNCFHMSMFAHIVCGNSCLPSGVFLQFWLWIIHLCDLTPKSFFIFSLMSNLKTRGDTGSYGGQRKNVRGTCMSIIKSPGSLSVYICLTLC